MAKLARWFRAVDDELEVRPYLIGAAVGAALQLPILYAGGCSAKEIVLTIGCSFSGALGLSMLMELYLHSRD